MSEIVFGLAPSAQPANRYAAGLGTEKQWMDELARRCLARLRGYARPGLVFDAYLEGASYADNVRTSNARGWTHHLALHTNADADPNNDKRIPAMAFWHSSSAQGEKLARTVAGAIAGVNPYGLGACYAWDGLAELSDTRAVAALVELREHDTEAGARDIIDHLDRYADAVIGGILDYLEAEHGFSFTAAPYVHGWAGVIEFGSRGEDVRRLQDDFRTRYQWAREILDAHGGADGIAGKATLQVIAEWQQRMNTAHGAGLRVDGAFGPKSNTAAHTYEGWNL